MKGRLISVCARLGQLDFRFFGRLAQALNRLAVLSKVNALVFLELFDEPIDDALVPVVAAQVGVAVGGQYFDHAIAYFENGDIERTAAEVKDEDVGLCCLSKP
jgi:hypothetical protein